MSLSDAKLRTLKTRERQYKLYDDGGLYVLVMPNGSRLWRMDFQLNHNRRTLAFGKYPAVTLAAARAKRDAARIQLDLGIDPTDEKRQEKEAEAKAASSTFGAVATEYLNRLRHDGMAASTIKRNKWTLEKLAVDLHDLPIGSITPAQVLDVLQRVERSGRLASANRLRSTISAVFRLAVATLRATSDPTRDLRGALRSPVTVNHPALTDERAVGALLASIYAYDGWPTIRAAMIFTALTAARPGEVRAAQWCEIDLSARKWTIPAQRTKVRREHVVPLCRQAVAVLEEIRQLSGRCALVFPSIRSDDRPLSENAMNSALRRMGYTHDEHTSHGFRSTFSTILNEREHDPEVIELCLAHQDGSVRGIYNRARKWEQRVALMQTWGDLLDELRGGQADEDASWPDPPNVIRLFPRR